MVWRCVFLLSLLLPALSAGQADPERPYVVLVALDGFRYDYAELHGAPNIEAIGAAGVKAEAMRPIFPSLTYPSHYAMATGMLPVHNGIVENRFYDPSGYRWNMDGARQVRWHRGTPIWTLAEQQGVPAATYFWPAGTAEIHGVQPTHSLPYDGEVPNEQRVAQVLDWLALPPAQRPHMIALYFSDADSAGHRFGPEAPETRDAVAYLDVLIGDLRQRLAATGLPVNLIVVSDHGMIGIEENVVLGQKREFEGMRIWPDSGSQVMLYGDTSEQVERAYRRLKQRQAADAASHDGTARFQVYRREEIPATLLYRDSERIGDIVVIANEPVALRMLSTGEDPAALEVQFAGDHGFDSDVLPEMLSIFYAEGPNFASRRGNQALRQHRPLPGACRDPRLETAGSPH